MKNAAVCNPAAAPIPTLESVAAALRDRENDLRKIGVKSLAVFGSVVAGNADNESDVDLCATIDDARAYARYKNSVFAVLVLQRYCRRLFGRKLEAHLPTLRQAAADMLRRYK